MFQSHGVSLGCADVFIGYLFEAVGEDNILCVQGRNSGVRKRDIPDCGRFQPGALIATLGV
jgi:hypothetical protein